MAKTFSNRLFPLGKEAPNFCLPSVNGYGTVDLASQNGSGFLIVFWCNHCPYVKHIAMAFAQMIKPYQSRGISVFMINSNNAEKYPDDNPEKMVEAAREWKFDFPYLYDESQEVAKSYKAVCTPDFYLFDKDKKLFYRGQMDASRPGNTKAINGDDLKNALSYLLQSKPLEGVFIPSMGCNIKWKEGNEPIF